MIITEAPACDWLTLTTYEAVSMRRFADLLAHRRDGLQQKKVMQYEGEEGGSIFIGSARQRGRDHYMIRVSGGVADEVLRNKLIPEMDCTRIDIQMTLPLPFAMRESHTQYKISQVIIDAHEENRGARARSTTLVGKKDGYCTLYVGSRTSNRFYRIYVKEVDGAPWLRFEVEYKSSKSHAGKAYRRMRKDYSGIASMLAAEVRTLPDTSITRPFLDALAGDASEVISQARQRPDSMKTLAWMQRSVAPAVMRMLNDHDARTRMVAMLNDWQDAAREMYGD